MGISLGSANLVAVTGGRPIVRPTAVTVRPGVTVTGFVDRVGDPVPMLAADGSAHRADRLTAAAVEAATRQASPRQRPLVGAIATPGHWSDGAVAALRAVVPHLLVVPDTTAALTAVAAGPGLPTQGVVLLVDVGAAGTSITLADTGAGFAPIGPTVRCEEFSGDLVDQAVLRHVLDGLDVDPAGTAAVEALRDLRAESRAAKERLSQVTATAVAGGRGPVRVTRGELETLIAAPLDRLIATVIDVLDRARIAPSAVVTVGGGARIPIVTQRLSEALRCPVRSLPYPQVAAATGAELLARRSIEQQAATIAVPAAATELAPALPALAWSAEDSDAAETEFRVPAAAPVEAATDTGAARPAVLFGHHDLDAAPSKKRAAAPVWLAGAACVAAIAAAAVLLTAQIARSDETATASGISTPVAMHALEPSAAPPAAAPPADTVTQTVQAPAQAPAEPQSQPAPAVPQAQQGQVVAKQAAPAPAPAAPAPVPAPAAPAPVPAPAPAAPVWPRIPLPRFTFPAPTPKPSSEPAPSATPEPTPTPTPKPTSEPTPTPEPSATREPTPSPEPAPTSAPSSEAPATTTASAAEPTTVSPSASESPSA